ncbi:MAG: hypothetical protein AB7T27_06075 [Kiritimatiellia bacterium]
MKKTAAILAMAAVSTAALLHADETVVEKNLYRPTVLHDYVEAPGATPSVQNPPPATPSSAASRQPPGALSDIVVFCSAGHGWTSKDSAWISQRPLLYGVNEDAGNIDQLNLFAQYCFNAGATVVPFRPLGYQASEVVMDNTDSGVTYAGTWYDSVSSIYFGRSGDVPYRYAFAGINGQTASARFAPNLPAAGFYPVYCWVRSGADRVEQLYRIGHSGGQTEVRVNHERVGLGWVWLGNYHFEAGTNGFVEVSNDALPGRTADDVVVADAIRFGNGMGDIDRGHGVSGYERELECSRYWIEKSVGQGMGPGIYNLDGYDDQDDNVGAPRRMTEEMNREQAGGFWDRVFLGFHSNAGSGAARGALGLYDTRYAEDVQQRQMAYGQVLADEINTCMEAGDDGKKFSGDWSDVSGEVLGGTFGELYGAVGSEMNNTIIEVAFHDNEEDCLLMKNPDARAEIARACYQGTVRHLNANNPSNVPLAMLPEPPESLRVYGGRRGVVVEWDPPAGPAAEGYVIYSSRNGYGFGGGIVVTGETSTSVMFNSLPPDEVRYFRVAAWNRGGESLPSTMARVRTRAAGPESLEVIYMPVREKLHATRRWFGGGLSGQVTLLRPSGQELPAIATPVELADVNPAETAQGSMAGGADSAPVPAAEINLAAGTISVAAPAPRKCSRDNPECIFLPGQDRCLNYFHARECKEQAGVL